MKFSDGLIRHLFIWIVIYQLKLNPKFVLNKSKYSWEFKNIKYKNTLTGPANCKKPIGHHAHLYFYCAKSRKTNDVKSRKWPQSSISAIFDDFKVRYLQVANFSEK